MRVNINIFGKDLAKSALLSTDEASDELPWSSYISSILLTTGWHGAYCCDDLQDVFFSVVNQGSHIVNVSQKMVQTL